MGFVSMIFEIFRKNRLVERNTLGGLFPETSLEPHFEGVDTSHERGAGGAADRQSVGAVQDHPLLRQAPEVRSGPAVFIIPRHIVNTFNSRISF